MKRIVLIVVGAILAIAMIPIIVTSINRMTQEKEVLKEVEVTIDADNEIYTPLQSYNDISEYSIVDVNDPNGIVKNISSVYFNDEISTSIQVGVRETGIYFSGDTPDLQAVVDSYISDDGNWYNDGGSVGGTFTLKLVFEVTQPAQVTGVGAALLNLVPILFVVGTVFSLVIFTKELE